MDRSNGFEKKLLTQVCTQMGRSKHQFNSEIAFFQGVNKMAQEEEAYKWSTEDM